MFNIDNKTHYKMYKAGKRWMFGAITVSMFTAGIAGGAHLSNGKSVHADTTVSATTANTESNVQANQTKVTPATQNNNDQNQDTSSKPAQTTDNKADQTKQQSDNIPQKADDKTTMPAPKADSKSEQSQAKNNTDNKAVDNSDQTDQKNASNETPNKATNDLADKAVAPINANVDNTTRVSVSNQQSQKADDVNYNVHALVLASQGDGQDYTYNASTGDGIYGTAKFHFDQSTGTLTFIGGGELAQTDGTSNYWNEIGHNVKHIVFDGDVNAPIDSQYLFAAADIDYLTKNGAKYQYYINLQSIEGISHLKTSSVQIMNGMFSNYANYSQVTRKLDPSFIKDLSGFDTSHVKYFDSVFSGDQSSDFSSISNWNVSQGTEFEAMFCSNKLNDLNAFSKWDMSNATDLNFMFQQNNLKDISGSENWNVSNVKTLIGTFEQNIQLADINDLGNWKTGKVENFMNTFAFCSLNDDGVKSLSNWDVHSGKSFWGMFYTNQISKVQSFELWNVCSGINFSEMFAFNKITDASPLSKWNMKNAINVSEMFSKNQLNNINGLNIWDVENVTNFEGMFAFNQLKSVDLSNWNTSNGTDFYEMFENNPSLEVLNISGWDMSNCNSNAKNQNGPKGANKGTGTYHFFSGDNKLHELILGPNAKFFSDSDLHSPEHNQAIPDGTNHLATGHWEEDGNGSETNPNGLIFDGNYANLKQGTWVWQPEKENIDITFVDDANGDGINAKLPFEAGNDCGLVGDNNSYSLQKYIDMLTKLGYAWIKTSGEIPSVFDYEGNQKVMVHFNHRHSTIVDESGKGSETIHYVYSDGSKVADDVIKNATFSRTGDKDDVTGDIAWSTWKPNSDINVSVNSPVIKGYTPNQKQVNATISEGQSKNITVTYTVNKEQAHVQYVDQDDNNKVLDSADLSGEFGEKSGYTTQEEIGALEAEGYELVSDGYPVGYTFNTDNPTFTVVLKHKTKNVTPDNPGTPSRPVDPNNPDGPKYPDGTGENDLVKTITRTIHYKDDQGRTVSKDVVETTKFSRTATFDEVTGKVTYSAWNPTNDTFIEVDSPVVDGYYTDTAKVGAETINVDANNSEVTVVYHAMGHLVPDVPGTTPVPYPNDPTNPSDAGNPIIPNIPGYTPVDPNGNKMTPGTPYPINPNEPGKDTPIHYVKNEVPATPVTPSIPAEKPSVPVNPANNDIQAPTAQKSKNAEAPKSNALPQTGQDSSTSLMSVIGMILIAILGFLGLDGFKKRNENK